MTDAPSPRCSSGADEAREPFERFIVRAGFTDWTRHEDGYLKPLVDRLWRAWPRGIAQAGGMPWEHAETAAIDDAAYYVVQDNGHEWRDFDLTVQRGTMVRRRLEPSYVRGRPEWIAKVNRPSPLSSTNSCSAATKHSGTFLGYRDEHGNEMHCAHAFCPHQAKCRKGCINPVAVTSTHSGGEA